MLTGAGGAAIDSTEPEFRRPAFRLRVSAGVMMRRHPETSIFGRKL